MKKVRLILILLAVGGLSFWAYKLAQKEGGNAMLSDEALSDFAVSDTSSIDQLVLTDTEGNKGVTLVKKGITWEMDNGECVQQHLVMTMLETIKYIKVKSPVPKSSMETVNKNLTTHHRKMEIYQNKKLVKTWYIGQPTQDQYGTYMLLKDPIKGKSPEPFIMYLPNMHGNLETRFITNPLDFQCTGIFNYEPSTVKSIEVLRPDSMQYSFKLDVLESNKFQMTRKGESIPKFDTTNVRTFILAFKKIHFEQHNYLIDKKSVDSLKSTTPWFKITVTDTDNKSKTALCYRKRMIYEKYDFDGNLIEFDRDRLWVVTPGGELVVGQYHVFDKILRDIRTFVPIEAL